MGVPVIPIPTEVVSHSQFCVLFPFPSDSHGITVLIGNSIPMHISTSHYSMWHYNCLCAIKILDFSYVRDNLFLLLYCDWCVLCLTYCAALVAYSINNIGLKWSRVFSVCEAWELAQNRQIITEQRFTTVSLRVSRCETGAATLMQAVCGVLSTAFPPFTTTIYACL